MPNMGAGCCLGPEGNGSAWGKGAREGPAPQEAGKISSQCSMRAEATWTRARKDGQIGVMKKDQREQSEPFSSTRWDII